MAIPKTKFDLDKLGIEKNLTKTQVTGPAINVIYSKGGAGKSSICANLPDSIILPVGLETGHFNMPVVKFSRYDELCLSSSDHVFAMLQWVLEAKHTRQNLVVDNLGTTRIAFDDDIIRDNPNEDMSKMGKGGAASKLYWNRFLKYCDEIVRRRNVGVWLLGHELDYTINNDDGSYYTKTSLNLPGNPSAAIRQLFEERCENIFYLRTETNQRLDSRGISGALANAKTSEHKKKMALSGGIKRVIYTREQGGFFAKSRGEMDDSYEIEPSDSKKDLLNGGNASILKFLEDARK